MPAPVIVNGGFESPVLADGGFQSPMAAGHGWTQATAGGGLTTGRALVGRQSVYTSTGIGDGFWQDLVCDGSPFVIRAKAGSATGTAAGVLRITIGTQSFDFNWPLSGYVQCETPVVSPSGTVRLAITRVSGGQGLFDDVEAVAAPTAGRLIAPTPGASGLVLIA